MKNNSRITSCFLFSFLNFYEAANQCPKPSLGQNLSPQLKREVPNGTPRNLGFIRGTPRRGVRQKKWRDLQSPFFKRFFCRSPSGFKCDRTTNTSSVHHNLKGHIALL